MNLLCRVLGHDASGRDHDPATGAVDKYCVRCRKTLETIEPVGTWDNYESDPPFEPRLVCLLCGLIETSEWMSIPMACPANAGGPHADPAYLTDEQAAVIRAIRAGWLKP